MLSYNLNGARFLFPPTMPSIAISDSSDTSSPRPDDPTPASPSADGHRCQWEACSKVAPDPEALYTHLCNDHIGRKSTNNLCLSCKWKDCGTTCAKRDHITSHLRGQYLTHVVSASHPHIQASAHPSQATHLRYLRKVFQTTSRLEEA